MDIPESFSSSQVARYCHVTADTIRKWADAGRIAVFKTPGGHRRIRREDLIEFLNTNNIPIHPDLKVPGFKVLVVDHENAVISTVGRFLDRAAIPFRVEVARDLFDAGRQLALFRPDVVFLDLDMPGVDALAVCKRIKSLPEHAGIHVIALARSADSDIARRAMEQGALLCLRKPCTPDDLRRALAHGGIEVA